MVATVVELASSAAALSYYERDGYYAKNDPEHRQASFWHGAAAGALGLRGHVHPRRFEELLSGEVPDKGIRLGRMREGERQHRPRLGPHLLGPEVRVSGGIGRRRPQGDPGARRGGPRDAGLDRGGALGDARLGSGDGAAPPREGGRHGRRRVQAPDEPEAGSAAAHALRAGEHDADGSGRVAQRRADPDPAEREAGGRLLPQRARAPAAGARHGDGAHDGRAHSRIRARGLRPVVPGGVLGPSPRDSGPPGAARAPLYAPGRPDGRAAHAAAQARRRPRGTGPAVAGAGAGVRALARQNGARAAPARRPGDRHPPGDPAPCRRRTCPRT